MTQQKISKMRTYTLVAINNQGASIEFGGVSMAECKRNFSNTYDDITDFTAKIYDNGNGALCQIKRIGLKTYQNPE